MTKTIVALALAALWSIALLIAAMVAPFYASESASSSSSASVSAPGAPPTTVVDQSPVVTHTSSTLVEENGVDVLGVVAVPLLAVTVVSLSLWRRHRRGKQGPGPLAWAVTALVSLFTLAAMLSIGIFVVPVTFLLVLACVFAIGAPSPGRRDVDATGALASPAG